LLFREGEILHAFDGVFHSVGHGGYEGWVESPREWWGVRYKTAAVSQLKPQ
jgi:hypothetical protein